MFHIGRRKRGSAEWLTIEAKRQRRRRQRTCFLPQLERLESRDCPSLGVGTIKNLSKMLDNQSDATFAINPANPQQMFVASTSFHGGYDGGSYYAGGTLPPFTNGLFFSYSSDGGSNWTSGVMATGTDDHEFGYGLPAAGHFPHAAFDQYGNLFLSYIADHVQFRGVGSTVYNSQTGTETLTDSGANWFPNEWNNKTLSINGSTYSVTSNTQNTLTFTAHIYDATYYYEIWSTSSSTRSIEVVQSIDGGTFSKGVDYPPSQQNFTWLTAVNNFGGGPGGPLIPMVETGPGFGTTLVSGTSTGNNTSTTLNDTSQHWSTNQFAGDLVVITGTTGSALHQAAVITSNTATQLTVAPAWGVIPNPVPPNPNYTYKIGTKVGSVWVGYENVGGNPAAIGAPTYGLGLGSQYVGNFIPEIQIPTQSQTYITVSGLAVGPAGQVLTSWVTQKYSPPQPPKPHVLTAVASGLLDTQFSSPLSAATTYVGMDYGSIPASAPMAIDAAPQVAYDTDTSSAHYGRAYLVYVDSTGSGSTDTNIFGLYSDNNGLTSWSQANSGHSINDDGTTTSQFWPQLAVDPTTGYLGVTWYDARDDTQYNVKVSLFGTVSTNGGTSFQTNQRITRYPTPDGRSDGAIANLESTGTISSVSNSNLTDNNQLWTTTTFPPPSGGGMDWWQAWTPYNLPLTPLFTVSVYLTDVSPPINVSANVVDNTTTTLSLQSPGWGNTLPDVGDTYSFSGDGEGVGRYTGLAFYNGQLWPAWADNSNSTGDNPNRNKNTSNTNVWQLNIYTVKVTVTAAPSPLAATASVAGPAVGELSATRLEQAVRALALPSVTSPVPALAIAMLEGAAFGPSASLVGRDVPATRAPAVAADQAAVPAERRPEISAIERLFVSLVQNARLSLPAHSGGASIPGGMLAQSGLIWDGQTPPDLWTAD